MPTTETDKDSASSETKEAPVTHRGFLYPQTLLEAEPCKNPKATDQPLYNRDELDSLGYRMWETEGMIDGLVYRHSRAYCNLGQIKMVTNLEL